MSESPKTLYADLSCYNALDSCTLSKMPLSEISKLLPHTVKLCARPFTACLVGHYSQGSFGGPAAGNTWLESELNSLIISQDSKVRLFSRSIIFPTEAHRWQYEGERCGEAWEDYLQKSGASIQGHEEVSKVHQVHRGAWSLKLQMAPPRLEVIYPPLSLLELENGRFIDLSSWPCPRKPALLSTTRITEMGYIRQGAEECIVSFPGKYAHAWRSWDTSVACVFMCDELFGDHSPQCYCRQLYGSRGFRRLASALRAVSAHSEDLRLLQSGSLRPEQRPPLLGLQLVLTLAAKRGESSRREAAPGGLLLRGPGGRRSGGVGRPADGGSLEWPRPRWLAEGGGGVSPKDRGDSCKLLLAEDGL